MVNRKDVDALMNDRVKKFTAADVNYGPVPDGSAFRCSSCLHGYSRHSDGFSICEIMRPKNDDPILPDHGCDYWTVDGYVYPLTEETEEAPVSMDGDGQ